MCLLYAEHILGGLTVLSFLFFLSYVTIKQKYSNFYGRSDTLAAF